MRRRQRRRHGSLLAVLITIGILAAAAAVLLGLFRIRSIEVVGASAYTAESIQEDLIDDFWSGNTLVFGWRYRSAVYESKTPYLSTVQAKILSPGRVRVTVEEKTVIGYVLYGGNAVSFDADGLVLDISDTPYTAAILVTGLTMDEPVLYQKLPVGNTALLRTMLSVLRLLRDNSDTLQPDSVSFDSNLNITVNLGQVSVDLGQDEYLEEKVANLTQIYPQIAGQSGTLSMSAFTGNNEQIAFRETETEVVTEAEPQGEDADSSDDEALADDTAVSDGENDAALDGETSVTDGTSEDAASDTSSDTDNLTVGSGVLVFDSSGSLHSDARIVNGQVVDSSGSVIDGCSVTEEGYIKDGYWNIIDPATGDNLNDSYY